VLHDDDRKMETHFVNNPFIQKRETISQKQKNSNRLIGESQLKNDEDADMREAPERDIYIAEESGKMHVKDLEQEEIDKNQKKDKRKKLGYDVDSDTDSDDDRRKPSQTKGQTAQQLRKLIKSQKASRGASTFERKAASSKIGKAQKRGPPSKKNIGKSGHIIKESGDKYLGKGKGDVLKAGEHEPYAYI